MSNKLIKFTIIFENCEVLEIAGDNINRLYIDDVSEYYCKHPGSDSLYMRKEAGKVVFTVSDFRKELQGRLLQYQDITSITPTCEFGIPQNFRVKWESELGCDENSKQFYQYFGKDLDIYIGYDKEEMGIE